MIVTLFMFTTDLSLFVYPLELTLRCVCTSAAANLSAVLAQNAA